MSRDINPDILIHEQRLGWIEQMTSWRHRLPDAAAWGHGTAWRSAPVWGPAPRARCARVGSAFVLCFSAASGGPSMPVDQPAAS